MIDDIKAKHSIHCESANRFCPKCNIKLECQCCYVGGGSYYWSLQCPSCKTKFSYDTYAFKLYEYLENCDGSKA